MNKKIDFITLSPLIILVFIPLSSLFTKKIALSAAHPSIAFIKYLCIPLIGFSIGSIFFIGVLRHNWKPSPPTSLFIEKYSKQIITFISLLCLFYLSTISVLRYTSLHTTVYDMGTYDKKIWKISVAPISKIFYEISYGHFQPILFLYSLFYKIIDNPIIIQLTQSIGIISGVIPLYLLGKHINLKSIFIISFIIIYLFYPPVGFNAALEFHPDHIYVPFMLWSFFFAEKNKYILATLLVSIGALAKEPYILGAAFFGLYLILTKKQYKLGFIVFLVFSLFFLFVIFVILPNANHRPAIDQNVFPIIRAERQQHNGIVYLKHILDALLIWKTRKMLFIYFTLSPLLFLPIFDWKRFLPAFPFFIIPVLSTTYLHSSVDSQYTSGIIAPGIVALIYTTNRIKKTYGLKYANAIIVLLLTMIFTFNVAHGPTPLSISFWKKGWAEMWHISSYKKGAHENIIDEAIFMVSDNPEKSITIQSNINNSRLAHRKRYFSFPDNWQDADFILLDIGRPLMIGGNVDKVKYLKIFKKLKANPNFKLKFENDGVLLFKKKKN